MCSPQKRHFVDVSVDGLKFYLQKQHEKTFYTNVQILDLSVKNIHCITMYGFDSVEDLVIVEKVLPILVDIYWVLAIGAALVTILPIPGIDWFRYETYIYTIAYMIQCMCFHVNTCVV